MVEDQRQVAVGAHELRDVRGDGLLVGHREHELGALAVLQLEQLLDRVAPGLAPRLGGLEHRHQQLLAADRVDLLADDLHDPLVHAPAGRQPRPHAGAELADEAGADHQLVRDRLGVGGRLALGRQQVVGEAGHRGRRAYAGDAAQRHGPRGYVPLIEQRSPNANQGSDKEPHMAYSVPPLPYAYDALEPYIDKATMEFHHDKHHQAYVDNVNAALEGTAAGGHADRGRAARPRPGARGQARRGQKQRRRPLQPLAVLGEHDARRRRRADGELGEAIDSDLRLLRDFKAKVKATGVGPVRLRLVVARARRRRPGGRRQRQPGQPDLRRQDAAARRGRVGARLLPEVPEPPPRLPRRVVERRGLAQGSPSDRGGVGGSAAEVPRSHVRPMMVIAAGPWTERAKREDSRAFADDYSCLVVSRSLN